MGVFPFIKYSHLEKDRMLLRARYLREIEKRKRELQTQLEKKKLLEERLQKKIKYKNLRDAFISVHQALVEDTVRRIAELKKYKSMISQDNVGKIKIYIPPGMRLNAISEFLYSKKTYERIFQQTIANMQDEYFEALHENRAWKARWVRVRGTWSVWAAAAMQVPVSSSKLIKKIWTLVG